MSCSMATQASLEARLCPRPGTGIEGRQPLPEVGVRYADDRDLARGGSPHREVNAASSVADDLVCAELVVEDLHGVLARASALALTRRKLPALRRLVLKRLGATATQVRHGVLAEHLVVEGERVRDLLRCDLTQQLRAVRQRAREHVHDGGGNDVALEGVDGGDAGRENLRTAAPQLADTEARSVLGSFLFSGDDAAKPAGVLSGGEKTRLALAILVVSSANVLLLDEPTNNLDPASRAEVLAAIRSYEGAIVLVTHDEGAVDALEPDRVLILPDGVEDLWGDDYRDLVELA